MSHNLAELPLSRRRALEREKQACLRLHLSRNRASERLERAVRDEVERLLGARERQGAGWPGGSARSSAWRTTRSSCARWWRA